MNHFKDYYLKKASRAIMPAYGIIGGVVIASFILTLIGKVGGETFSFLMGAIVGYIISLMSKHV